MSFFSWLMARVLGQRVAPFDVRWTADGWLDEPTVARHPAHPGRIGGPIKPRAIIWHCTDMAHDTEAALIHSWITQPGVGNCAHFLIHRSGVITQFVPVSHNANHAGGRDHGTINGKHPNLETVGIELANPGRQRVAGEGLQHYTGLEMNLRGYWEPYTPAQLLSARWLAAALGKRMGAVPATCRVERPVDDARLPKSLQLDPLGLRHCDINPIQKTDPGPYLSVDALAAAARGADK